MRKSMRIGFGLAVWCFLAAVACGSEALYPPMRLSEAAEREGRGLASYAKAVMLLQSSSENWPAVCAHLSEALVHIPDSSMFLPLLVHIRSASNDWESLLRDLEAPLAANPDSVGLDLEYASCLVRLKRGEEAERRLQAILVRHRHEIPADAVILYASLLLDKQQPAQAKRLLRRSLRRMQPGAEAFKLRVFAFEMQLTENKAAAAAQAAVEKGGRKAVQAEAARRKAAKTAVASLLADPAAGSSLAATVNLMSLLASAEFWPEIIALLDKHPDLMNESEEVLPIYFTALCRVDAQAALKKVVEAIFSNRNEDVQLQVANLLIDEQQYGLALALYEKLHLRDMGDVGYRLRLAWLYGRTGLPKRGLTVLEPIRNLPFGGLHLQSMLYAQSGQAEKAYATIQAAAALAGKESPELLGAEFYLTMGFRAEMAGRADDAVDAFRRAWNLDREDANLANALGYTLADRDQELELAEKLIGQAVAAEPDNVAYLDSLAWLHFRRQRPRQALEAMAEVLRRQPSGAPLDTTIRDHLVEILQANGYDRLAASWQPPKNANAENSR